MLRGIVQRHATNVCIKDVDFVVRAAGHRKVLEQKRKNVHAFCRGTNIAIGECVTCPGKAIQISYNPYKGPHFYRKDTGEAVKSAAVVELRDDKTVWAWGIENAN
jgi:hypothetical protein